MTDPAGGSELLGEGHRAIVEMVSGRLSALRVGDVYAPRVMVLEGPSGAGKSRIVREFYRRLQAAQPNPGYWPELAEATRISSGAGADPFADRKKLGPPVDRFIWPPGALPSFLWWPFNCDRMAHGDLLDVVAQAEAELRAHLVPAALAWRDAAGWGERIRASKAEVTDLAREALSDAGSDAAVALLASLNVVVPVFPLWTSWLLKAGKALRRNRDRRQMLADEVDLHEHASGARSNAAEEIAGLLASATHVEVPSVVVIEDLHLMGSELGELVDRLAAPRADKPVLVVATAWPEGRSNPPYAHWRAQAQAAGRLEMVPVPELDAAARIALLRRSAPTTSDADAARIIERYHNPLALQMLLSLRKVRARIARSGGALALGDAELAELPSDVRDLYRQRWRELPAGVRDALMVAAGGLPDVASTGAWSFLRDVVAEAGGRSGLLGEVSAGEITAALKAAEDPYYWQVAKQIEEATVAAFREAVLAEIASLDLREQFDEGDIVALRAATVAVLSEWVERERGGRYVLDEDDEGVLVACRWLWALSADGGTTVPVSVAGLTVARAQAAAFHYRGAVETLAARDTLGPLQEVHPDTLDARSRLAEWLGKSGDAIRAIDQLRALVADRTRILGADHPATLAARNDLAYWLYRAGQLDGALGELRALLADRTRILGADHPDTLTARNNLATLLGETSELDQAVNQLQALVADRTRILGADHPATLAARSNLASMVGETGQLDEAINQFRSLLADRTRILGADHPDTLETRSDLASWLYEADQLDEAGRGLHAVLADRTRILGADHPDTLISRNNLASWLGKTGQLDEAINQFRALLADSTCILGADHPTTLTYRSNLASWLVETGQRDEAVNQFRALLADSTRILGADHPTTQEARQELVGALGAAGRVEEAVSHCRTLVTDRARTLGADHSDTLFARRHLALWVGNTEDVDGYIAELEGLLADSCRVLGVDHRDTLLVRNMLASALYEADLFHASSEQFRQLVADRTRVQGGEHQLTLVARNNLASALRKSGRIREAVEQLRVLVADSTRILGADHPDTRDYQDFLAHWLEQLGDNEGTSGDGVG